MISVSGWVLTSASGRVPDQCKWLGTDSASVWVPDSVSGQMLIVLVVGY